MQEMFLAIRSPQLCMALTVLLIVDVLISTIATMLQIGRLTKIEIVDNLPYERRITYYKPKAWSVFISIDPVAKTVTHLLKVAGVIK